MNLKLIVTAFFIFSSPFLIAQDIARSHSFGLLYSGMNVNEGISHGPLNASGIGLQYQYITHNDWAYGIQLAYAKGTEDFDIYGDPHQNDYEIFNYNFLVRYNFLEGKFKLYIGLNIGGNSVKVKSTWELQDDVKSNGMVIGFPLGFNWYVTKNIFITAGGNASMFIGKSLYISDAIIGYNAGVGYYIKLKNTEAPVEEN